MNSAVAARCAGRGGAVDSLYVVSLWLMQQQRYRDAAAVARALVRLAPYDERSWLVLGACHERGDETELALEMYGVGRTLAAPAPRCELARARLLRQRGMQTDACAAYAAAESAAHDLGDDALMHFIEKEGTRWD
ncbi:MAG TPA: hypothetical protein VEK07_04615 [Polyangiaceae bacterium]|nr:hypothetical protein [Polyangiaceae bacterium]